MVNDDKRKHDLNRMLDLPLQFRKRVPSLSYRQNNQEVAAAIMTDFAELSFKFSAT